MSNRLILLALLCGILVFTVGCPGKPGKTSKPQHGKARSGKVKVRLLKTPDKYDALAACLTDQNRFTEELTRLQMLYTAPPEPDSAPRGENDARYGLSSVVERGRAGLRLEDRYGGPAWTLWCWDEDGSAAALQSRVTDMPDGLKLELQAGHGLSVTLLARWVNARYLQVSREVLLGGMDMADELPAGACRWRISGQWQPYRIVPSLQGPFGVAPDDTLNGKWQTTAYPAAAVAPALAAYSQTGGILLASGDKGARDLTRNYDLRWRLDSDYLDGELLELACKYYDGVQDAYVTPHIVSGLPIRDSVLVEPFQLTQPALDATLVEAQTRETLAHLGALARSFWFIPKPPVAPPVGSAIAIDEWVADPAQLDEVLRTAVGSWSAQLNHVALVDAKLGDTGYGGIGALDIGGSGLAPAAQPALEKLASQQLPSLQYSDYARVAADARYGNALAGWLIGTEPDAGGRRFLDLRNPQASAWIMRKHCADLLAAPAVGGYQFPAADFAQMPGAPEAGPYQIAQQQAGAFLQLALAEQLQTARPDCLLAIGGAPCLALPACANAYAPPVAISTRQFNTLLYELFGAEPWISTGESTLSQLVLSTTGHTRGFALPRSLAQFSGFEALSANLDGLRGSGGDMFIIHNVPPQSAYTSMGERPAVATEQIATLPGDWNGTRAVWICFEGTGGSVSVDAYNKATVTWPGGAWSRTLPGGIWKIEHPDPAQVKPGDVVLIKFSPLKAPLSQGSNAG